ncbi:MAG: NAD(P)-dependent dehydrogenase (short-subunit alcohol dehydrogenase family) [Bradymonadia bacterium]|jgi:NAD(P)-dependent dehydrogenase (short-subunit alcohol dehydrogenase family)
MRIETPGIAAITGGGSGFGKALSLELASHGWKIAIADIDLDGAEGTLAEVRAAGGDGCVTRMDTADESQVEEWANYVFETYGACHFLVNNAGVANAGDVGFGSLSDWKWLLGINLFGVIHGCHHFVPRMKQQDRGHILNVASIAAYACAPKMGAYNVSKAGVVALSETLAVELHDSPIGVSVLCPSFFKTNIANNSRGGDPAGERMAKKLVNNSKVSAEWVVGKVMRAIAKEKLYIVPQADAKSMWRLRRFAPNLMNRAVIKGTQLQMKRPKR